MLVQWLTGTLQWNWSMFLVTFLDVAMLPQWDHYLLKKKKSFSNDSLLFRSLFLLKCQFLFTLNTVMLKTITPESFVPTCHTYGLSSCLDKSTSNVCEITDILTYDSWVRQLIKWNLTAFSRLFCSCFPGMVSGKAPPPNPDALQWPPPAHPKRHIFC